MPIKKITYISEILKIYSSRPEKVAFFIGAGLSTPIFPSWKNLLIDAIELCEETGALRFNKNELLQHLEKGKFFPEVAEFCKSILSPTAYRDFLEQQFDKDFDSSSISDSYKIIFDLKPDLILTSNYDLIPQNLGSEYKIFSNGQANEAKRAVNQKKKVVFKLHGDISDQNSIVLTSKDYDRIISKKDVRSLLEIAFSAYTFIFIGFGLNDPHINLILREINSISSGMQSSHFALMPNITDFEAYVFEHNYSVKVIPYKPSAKDHPEVSSFLKLLQHGKIDTLAESFNVLNTNDYSNFSSSGIIKITSSNSDRISDYKKCLEDAEGDIFITGTSMIHLSEDSSSLLQHKCSTSRLRLLILDPSWVEENYFLFTFLQDDSSKKGFHLEIRNSLKKLNEIRNSLPSDCKDRFRIKTYKTIFPYIITGFQSKIKSKAVVEVTDYIPSKSRPRLTLNKINSTECLFTSIKDKFEEIWNSDFLTSEFN